MDSLFTEGELMTLHNDFHHAQYQKVIDFDLSSVSPEAALPARVLQLRAQIAQGHAIEVVADVEGEEEVPDLAAIKALALYASGDESTGLAEAEKLAESASDNASVQVLAGTVLVASGKAEEALSLLAKHQGSLEAVALVTQIHLMNNRTDLALKEVTAAKKWAQDSLLVNIAESWVGLRIGGEKYQQSFYEFEEMPVAQSVAEIHLGRLPEAETTLKTAAEAADNEAQAPHAIANLAIVQTLAGKQAEAADLLNQLKRRLLNHPLLADLEEKSSLFDEAAKKYSPKVAVS